MKIHEIISEAAPTIKSATGPHGQINRKTSDRIVDPRGYFAKNKKRIGRKGRMKTAADK
jgi:hypothetical protein